MKDVVFMFEVHQPYRLRRNISINIIKKAFEKKLDVYSLEDLLFDEEQNKAILERVTRKCYIPATRILIDVNRELKKQGKMFKIAFSISGVLLEQSIKWNRAIIDVFSEAVAEGFVEFIDQTYYHSLASLFPESDEFIEQLAYHKGLIKDIFGVEPQVAENTEFIFNNDIANIFDKLGYKVVLTEGVDHILGWRSPNYVYRAWNSDLRVLVRNYRLSDDIGFRFSDRKWDQYPLTSDKYADWIASTPGDVIFIAIDYETFGEHHDPSTGIHEFLRWLPSKLIERGVNVEFPSIAAFNHTPKDFYDVPPWATISWADERDLSAWLGNELQRSAFELYLYLEPYVKAVGGIYLDIWRKLGSSDHYYYMATKSGSAGEVHSYFSPYKDVVTAYRVYIEALTTLAMMVSETIMSNPQKYAINITVPPSRAFHFYIAPGKPLGVKCRNLLELLALLQNIPIESIIYHLKRGDLSAWLRNTLFLDNLAMKLDEFAKSMEYREMIKQRDIIRDKVIEMIKQTLSYSI